MSQSECTHTFVNSPGQWSMHFPRVHFQRCTKDVVHSLYSTLFKTLRKKNYLFVVAFTYWACLGLLFGLVKTALIDINLVISFMLYHQNHRQLSTDYTITQRELSINNKPLKTEHDKSIFVYFKLKSFPFTTWMLTWTLITNSIAPI